MSSKEQRLRGFFFPSWYHRLIAGWTGSRGREQEKRRHRLNSLLLQRAEAAYYSNFTFDGERRPIVGDHRE